MDAKERADRLINTLNEECGDPIGGQNQYEKSVVLIEEAIKQAQQEAYTKSINIIERMHGGHRVKVEWDAVIELCDAYDEAMKEIERLNDTIKDILDPSRELEMMKRLIK